MACMGSISNKCYPFVHSGNSSGSTEKSMELVGHIVSIAWVASLAVGVATPTAKNCLNSSDIYTILCLE